MRAEIKAIEATESADALFTEIALTLSIGPTDEESEDLFQVVVRSPRWLRKRLDEGRVVHAPNTIFMDHFDQETALSYLRSLVEGIEGSDWQAIVDKLRLIGAWEFEDYDPTSAGPR